MPRQKQISDAEILEAIEAADAPVATSTDVAEFVGITQQGAYKRLRQLAEEGRVERKKPNRDVLWWPAADSGATC